MDLMFGIGGFVVLLVAMYAGVWKGKSLLLSLTLLGLVRELGQARQEVSCTK